MSAYQQKINTLKNIKRFELINRLACYACVVPFLYATSCLGQQKGLNLTAKVGSVGFITATIGVLAAKLKEEKTEIAIKKMEEERKKYSY